MFTPSNRIQTSKQVLRPQVFTLVAYNFFELKHLEQDKKIQIKE